MNVFVLIRILTKRISSAELQYPLFFLSESEYRKFKKKVSPLKVGKDDLKIVQ